MSRQAIDRAWLKALAKEGRRWNCHPRPRTDAESVQIAEMMLCGHAPRPGKNDGFHSYLGDRRDGFVAAESIEGLELLGPEILEVEPKPSITGVGQPDGPGTPGHVWICRLMRKNGKEVPGTRTQSRDLASAVSASIHLYRHKRKRR